MQISFPWWTSLLAQMVKRLPAMQETQVRSLGWKILWRRKWQPAPVLLPGKTRGHRIMVGYCQWGRKESDMTEQLYSLSHANKRNKIFMLEDLILGKPQASLDSRKERKYNPMRGRAGNNL